MNIAVDFEGQAQLGAVEVRYERPDRMLPSELESEDATIAQQSPRRALDRRWLSPQPAGALDETLFNWIASCSHGGSVGGRRKEVGTELLRS